MIPNSEMITTSSTHAPITPTTPTRGRSYEVKVPVRCMLDTTFGHNNQARPIKGQPVTLCVASTSRFFCSKEGLAKQHRWSPQALGDSLKPTLRLFTEDTPCDADRPNAATT